MTSKPTREKEVLERWMPADNTPGWAIVDWLTAEDLRALCSALLQSWDALKKAEDALVPELSNEFCLVRAQKAKAMTEALISIRAALPAPSAAANAQAQGESKPLHNCPNCGEPGPRVSTGRLLSSAPIKTKPGV